MYGYEAGCHGLGFGWIGMVLFWVLLIVAAVMLFKSTTCHGASSARKNNALDILKERYARSEINREEFEQKKRDLSD
jgi:putative membrane protein